MDRSIFANDQYSLSIDNKVVSQLQWHLIASEFPPHHGGIAAYTKTLADGLSKAGHPVHVWCRTVTPEQDKLQRRSPHSDFDDEQWPFQVHRLGGNWSINSYRNMDSDMNGMPVHRRLFLQFTPQLFGSPLSLRLARWLNHRKVMGDQVWIMIHTPFYLEEDFGLWRTWALKYLRNRLIQNLFEASERIYVAHYHWKKLAEQMLYKNGIKRSVHWLPMMSNVLKNDDDTRIRNIRLAFAQSSEFLMGTFGGFDSEVFLNTLKAVIPDIMQRYPSISWVFIGRGSDDFVALMQKESPSLSHRLVHAGELDEEALSAHLQACDFMFQPYPEGVSSQRTSALAAISHGKTMITTEGANTESLWVDEKCVIIVPTSGTRAMVAAVQRMCDERKRKKLESRAYQTYKQFFSVESCIDSLTM